MLRGDLCGNVYFLKFEYAVSDSYVHGYLYCS